MFGQRVADRFAAVMGSWPFIIGQSIILVAWVVLNIAAWVQHWDPYPFILLNLMLSFQAAYAAPIIMMSQNRQEERDRQRVIQILRIVESGEAKDDVIVRLIHELVELLPKVAANITEMRRYDALDAQDIDEILAYVRGHQGESAAARNARAAARREEG